VEGLNPPCWRVVTAETNSKGFLEDEFKAVIALVQKAMYREVKIAREQIKRIKS